MGSAPHSASVAETMPSISPLTPDSSAFLQQVRSIKCYSSAAQLKRAAEETKQEVSKALQSINNIPFFPGRRLQSRSIHMVQLIDNRKRAATEAEERREVHVSLVKKEAVKCPPIKGKKELRLRLARKERVGSVMGLLDRK